MKAAMECSFQMVATDGAHKSTKVRGYTGFTNSMMQRLQVVLQHTILEKLHLMQSSSVALSAKTDKKVQKV